MQKIILIDRSDLFTSDVESRLLLGDYDFDIVSLNNLNDLSETVVKEKPDMVVMNAGLVDSLSSNDIGVPIYSYAKSSEDIQNSAKAGVQCFGLIKGVASLLNAIKSGKTITVEQSNTQPAGQEKTSDMRPARSVSKKPEKLEDLFGEDINHIGDIDEGLSEEDDVYDDGYEEEVIEPVQVIKKRKKTERVSQPKDDVYAEQTVNRPASKKAVKRDEELDLNARKIRYAEDIDDADDSEEDLFEGSIRDRIAKKKREEERKRKEAEERARQQHQAQIEEEVDHDLLLAKDPAKVITVYSAKGGVGKTTIATELSTYLALTSSGQGTYRVCIVDYNIDFGDVMNTLGMDPRKACMTLWAADIRERLKKEKMKNIKYTKEEIELYLQKDERSGLYALLAPITNEDSMDITDKELRVMLDNIINYGEFDFVICDTGNNTRDSSFIAITRADDVLMVLTQNINTANCNDSFLKMMEKIDFDTNKVKLVINRAVQGKQVSISTDELTEAFINPRTKQPYPCLSIIKDNIKVQYASNNSEPLVFNSSDKFTKSIGEIAAFVIGDTFVLEAPKKKKKFSIFGKR